MLALFVAAYHYVDLFVHPYWLQKLSHVAVAMFFVLSGWVLVRSYDDRFGVFLLRRLTRLWPTFAFGLVAGGLILHIAVPASRLLWFPMASPYAGAESDRPAWSLFIEAWAMLAMPLFVWGSRRAVFAVGSGALIFLAAMLLRLELMYGELFLFGACLSRVEWRCAWLERPWAQWLGKVSYSLYLTHWIVFQVFGAWGAVVVLHVAWVVWWAVERPSIELSRLVGRRVTVEEPA